MAIASATLTMHTQKLAPGKPSYCKLLHSDEPGIGGKTKKKLQALVLEFEDELGCAQDVVYTIDTSKYKPV